MIKEILFLVSSLPIRIRDKEKKNLGNKESDW